MLPSKFLGTEKKIDLCCYYGSSTSPIWSNLVRVPKPLSCGMNIQNFLQIICKLLDEHLSKKLEGWDFSFRNEASFCNCGSVSPLHIQRHILSYFYWVAPNYYDVFLIVLTSPFINFHHCSVFSVFKNARAEPGT